MVKIKYNGSLNPCNVSVLGNTYTNWYVGEVRDLPEKVVNKIILDNENFSLVSDKPRVEESKISNELESDTNKKIDISNTNSFLKKIKTK
jgi:hypothetical protein